MIQGNGEIVTASAVNHDHFLRRSNYPSERRLNFIRAARFGAVVVNDGQVLSEGINRVYASHDPTWHAEMEAIRLACSSLQNHKLHGCTLYSSAEPCPMCLAACYWAGIEKVFFGASVEDTFEYGEFDDQPIYEELALPREERKIAMTQILRDEAVAMWKQYNVKPAHNHS